MGEVTLQDISKQFTLRIDGAIHSVPALSHVNFKVHDGEIVALIGPADRYGARNCIGRQSHGGRSRGEGLRS